MIAVEVARDRARAVVDGAKADVALAGARLSEAKTELGKATIRSPISGVVLNRAAEPGQIVAASLNAPVLFTLAEDLARMELRVDVDEAASRGWGQASFEIGETVGALDADTALDVSKVAFKQFDLGGVQLEQAQVVPLAQHLGCELG